MDYNRIIGRPKRNHRVEQERFRPKKGSDKRRKKQ